MEKLSYLRSHFGERLPVRRPVIAGGGPGDAPFHPQAPRAPAGAAARLHGRGLRAAAGDPVPEESPLWPGYHDIDNGPTKSYILDNKSLLQLYFTLGFEKRPEEQLYNIKTDKGCVNNLAYDPSYQAIKENLKKLLLKNLKKQGDPRVIGTGDIYDSYPRFGAMRELGGFNDEGKYNPAFTIKKK